MHKSFNTNEIYIASRMVCFFIFALSDGLLRSCVRIRTVWCQQRSNATVTCSGRDRIVRRSQSVSFVCASIEPARPLWGNVPWIIMMSWAFKEWLIVLIRFHLWPTVSPFRPGPFDSRTAMIVTVIIVTSNSTIASSTDPVTHITCFFSWFRNSRWCK